MRLLTLGSMLLLGAGVVLAAPPEPTLRAAEADEPPRAGEWQGTWLLRREDSRIRTLGGSTALTLHIRHDTGSDAAAVRWLADRALCEDPVGEPCEWIGASGEARAVVNPRGLYAVLPVSADETDPLLLHMPRAASGTGATLLGARGDLHYSVLLTRK